MNADKAGLLYGEITEKVIGAFYETYNELGPGFLENVYESALALSITQAGLEVERQCCAPVYCRGIVVGDYRIDLLIERKLVIEVKAVELMARAHEAQLLNYLKAMQKPVGLLLNFGRRPQIKRMILTPDPIRVHPRSSVAKDHV